MDDSGGAWPELVLSRLPTLYAFEGEANSPRYDSDLLLLGLFAALRSASKLESTIGHVRASPQSHPLNGGQVDPESNPTECDDIFQINTPLRVETQMLAESF